MESVNIFPVRKQSVRTYCLKPHNPTLERNGKRVRNISLSDRYKTYNKDGFSCVICKSKDDLSIDHIFPMSKGGRCELSNYQTLCFDCNLKKRDKSMQEFIYDETKADLVNTYGMPEDVYLMCLEVGEQILGLNFTAEKKSLAVVDKVIDLLELNWGYKVIEANEILKAKDPNMAIEIGIMKAKGAKNV